VDSGSEAFFVVVLPRRGCARHRMTPVCAGPAWPSARRTVAQLCAPRPSPAPSARRSSAAPRWGLPTTLASSTDAQGRPRVLLALGHLLFRGLCLGRVLLNDRVHDGRPRSRPRGQVLPALGPSVLQGPLLLKGPGLRRPDSKSKSQLKPWVLKDANRARIEAAL
jgi:hypothetical protein